jgi:hypothetical protein
MPRVIDVLEIVNSDDDTHMQSTIDMAIAIDQLMMFVRTC